LKTRDSYEAVLRCLHEQGSTRITLEVLKAHTEILEDWRTPDGEFPCLGLQNGARWFYDRERRPMQKSGQPIKTMATAGHRALLGDLEKDHGLFLFEGERDWLTALSIGINGAICVGGTENLDELQLQAIGVRPEVIVFFDNDEAGRDASEKIAAQLVTAGCRSVKNARPPIAGQDFSEWMETVPKGDELSALLKLVREAKKIKKTDAKRTLKAAENEKDSRESRPEMTDEFTTPDGDPVALIFEYQDPAKPYDREQPVTVKFARYCRARSKKDGLLIVDYDSFYQPPIPERVQGDMYDPEKGKIIEEKPPLLRPIAGDWVNDRVILLPTGVKEHGTSEGLWDDILAFIDRYFVCDEAFMHAMTAYILLTYRYRDARFETIPYIRVIGDAGRGKSRFCRTMLELCYRGAFLTNMRAVHVYRLLHQMKAGVTMVFEEFRLNERRDEDRDFLDLLNAGNQRGARVPRMTGKQFSEMQFLPVFCPKVMAMTKDCLDQGLIRRCITGRVGHLPVPESKRMEALPDEFYKIGDELRRRLLGWRFARYEQLRPPVDPSIRGDIDMGVWQNFYPLAAMVPKERGESVEHIIALARETAGGLRSMHQHSQEAAALVACVRQRDKRERAWLNAVLQDLAENDRNARWDKALLFSVLRALRLRIRRSKIKDTDTGEFVNESYVNIDDPFKLVLVNYNIEVGDRDTRPNAAKEVM
jgi:5S rRNA maturation endonuclease (ribonuclease M5)